MATATVDWYIDATRFPVASPGAVANYQNSGTTVTQLSLAVNANTTRWLTCPLLIPADLSVVQSLTMPTLTLTHGWVNDNVSIGMSIVSTEQGDGGTYTQRTLATASPPGTGLLTASPMTWTPVFTINAAYANIPEYWAVAEVRLTYTSAALMGSDATHTLTFATPPLTMEYIPVVTGTTYAASDSATVSIGESSELSIFGFVNVSSSATVALTETSSLFKAISAINSVVPSIDGTAVVFEPIGFQPAYPGFFPGMTWPSYGIRVDNNNYITTVEDVTVAIADTSSIASTLGRVQTVTPSLTESSQILKSIVASDTVTPSLTGSSQTLKSISVADTAAVSVSNASSNDKYITTIEDVTVAVVDTSSVASTLGRVQSVTPSLTESSQILKLIPVTDTAVVSVSNASSNDKSSTVSNGVTPSVNGTATLFVEKSISDNASIGLTEVQNTGGIAYQTASGDANIVLTESAAVAKLNATGPSNSITVSIGESAQIDSMLGRTDFATPSINGTTQSSLSSSATTSVTPSVNGTASVTSVRYIGVSDSVVPSVNGTTQNNLSSDAANSVTISVGESVKIDSALGRTNSVVPSVNGTTQNNLSSDSTNSVTPTVSGTASITSVRYIEVNDSATPNVGGIVQTVASLTKSVVQNATISLIETASIAKSIALSNGVTPSINGTAQVERSHAVSTNVLPSIAGIAAVSKFDKPKTRARWRINGIWTEVETKVYVNGAWRAAPQKMYYNGSWRN